MWSLFTKKIHKLISVTISLLIFNKMLEKLISNRLLKFLEKEKLLQVKGQFGFCPKHSSNYAILNITDN